MEKLGHLIDHGQQHTEYKLWTSRACCFSISKSRHFEFLYTQLLVLVGVVFILFLLQVLSPDMSLATVRNYIWKKPEDLVLNYKVVQSR